MECSSGRPDAKRRGRPLRYARPLNLPLTAEQRDTVDRMAAMWRCSAAEAIRRVISRAEVPAPVERLAVDPAQYDALIERLNGVRESLNRTTGNAYRLTRDAYQSWSVPEPSEFDALRAEIEAARVELGALAVAVSEVSPWQQ